MHPLCKACGSARFARSISHAARPSPFSTPTHPSRCHTIPPALLGAAALVGCWPQVRKEFGKQKLFIPSQEGLAAHTPEQKAAAEARKKELEGQLRQEEEAVVALRRGGAGQGWVGLGWMGREAGRGHAAARCGRQAGGRAGRDGVNRGGQGEA